MIVAIVGGREITDYNALLLAVHKSDFDITAIVSGGARGVDAMAKRYAVEQGLYPDCYIEFLPKWDTYGKAAPIYRNKEIVEFSDAVIAIWDGQSRGTANSIKHAEEMQKPLYIERV